MFATIIIVILTLFVLFLYGFVVWLLIGYQNSIERRLEGLQKQLDTIQLDIAYIRRP